MTHPPSESHFPAVHRAIMVPLPLFKLAALFVRHISKYGANHIKAQAHDHPRFRAFAARYGQAIHQLNMRLSVASLRNATAEQRAREKAEAAEAPTVQTKEQAERAAREQLKDAADRAKYGTTARESHPATVASPRLSIWRRKFRPLPEAKAVDLFADVAGDSFILLIASALLLYEYYRTAGKPDANLERIKDLRAQIDALRAAESHSQSRILAMEAALRAYRDPKTKLPLLPPAPEEPMPAAPEEPIPAAPEKPGKPAHPSPPAVSPPAAA